MSHTLIHWSIRLGFVLFMAAMMFWAALPLWRDRKSSTRGRRVNVFALLSLLLLLGAVMVTGVAHFKWHFIQIPANRFPVGASLLGILWLSAICAVVGLVQIKRRTWQAGRRRAQAVLGVVILCFLSLLSAMAWRTIAGPQVEAHGFISRLLNFRFEIPSPWVRLKPRTLDPEAIFALARANPAMTFTVVARSGTDSKQGVRAFADTAKAKLAEVAPGIQTSEETPMKLHDAEGLLIESEAPAPISRLYVQWVGMMRQVSYRLTLSAPNALSRKRVREEAIAFFQGFDLLRGAQSPETAEAKDFHSLRSGFHVKLVGTAWNRPVSDLYYTFPSAEFVVGASARTILAVLPLPLGGSDPDIDMLSHVFLWRMGVESIKESVFELKHITHGPVHGVVFNFERSAVPGVLYRAEVLKGNGFGYVLLGMGEKTAGTDRQLADVFARIEFDRAPEQPLREAFTTRERLFCAGYLHDLGVEYLKKGRYADACSFFRQSQQIEPRPEFYVQSATEALMATGAYKAALAYLNAAARYGTPQTGELLVRQAWLQLQTGDTASALRSYETAFSKGFRSDFSLAEYARLLVRENLIDQAWGITEDYVRNQDALEARLVQVEIMAVRKQFDPALELLQSQVRKYPLDNRIRMAIASTHFAAGHHADALQQCDTLLKNGLSTAPVHFLKARCAAELKQFEEARNAVAEALRQEAGNAEIRAFSEKIAFLK